MDQATALAGRSAADRVRSDGLLAALDELRREPSAQSQSGGWPASASWPLASTLSAEDECLVADLRAGLGALLRSRGVDPATASADLCAALDGAEYAIREDIVFTHGARLSRLLPGLVFLALLPLCGEAEALSASGALLDLAPAP